MFVVQQIIHVLSGQLHLANAPLLSLLAAAGHPCASRKWTVNIDREDSRKGNNDLVRNEKESGVDGERGG